MRAHADRLASVSLHAWFYAREALTAWTGESALLAHKRGSNSFSKASSRSWHTFNRTGRISITTSYDISLRVCHWKSHGEDGYLFPWLWSRRSERMLVGGTVAWKFVRSRGSDGSTFADRRTKWVAVRSKGSHGNSWEVPGYRGELKDCRMNGLVTVSLIYFVNY